MSRSRQAGPRIVAGELGGRRLLPVREPHMRPSAERTREAIFSMLGPVGGLHALDLFCGTGALGIEALSRGAATATFVDNRIGTVAANVAALSIDERCGLVEIDAIAYLEDASDRFDLVLCDPPYRLAHRLGPELDRLLPGALNEGGRVITETSASSAALLGLPILRERRYGAAVVRIHGGPR